MYAEITRPQARTDKIREVAFDGYYVLDDPLFYLFVCEIAHFFFCVSEKTMF